MQEFYQVVVSNGNGYYGTFNGRGLNDGAEMFSTTNYDEAIEWFDEAVEEMRRDNLWCDGVVKLIKYKDDEAITIDECAEAYKK